MQVDATDTFPGRVRGGPVDPALHFEPVAGAVGVGASQPLADLLAQVRLKKVELSRI